MPPTDVDVQQEQVARYPHVVKALSEHPWAILPATLDKIVEVVRLRISGGRLSDEEIRLRIAGAAAAPTAGIAGRVQVIPIFGVISHRMNMFSAISGGTSTEQLGAQVQEALNDSRVSALLFDIDSPGGAVQGIQELADAIYAARGRKRLVACVNATCASAAYWLATQADEIVVTPSGQVGSIGVLAIHEDLSKQAAMLGVKVTYVSAGRYKTEGQPFVALTDEAKAALQVLVDGYYETFVGAVARGRRVKPEAVLTGFGEGRMFAAAAALALGMVDRIETMDQTLARLNGQTSAVSLVADTASLLVTSTIPKRTPMAETHAETLDPDPDGSCPEGYVKGDDGRCHMKPMETKGASMDTLVKDGEIVVTISELNALKTKAAAAERVGTLEQQLQRQSEEAAAFVDQQRERTIAFKVREIKIPAFRSHIRALYDMAHQVPEAKLYALMDPKVRLTAEAVIDDLVGALNKQADLLFRTLSVDTKPVDPNEPDQVTARIEYRVTEYVRANKLDRTKDYKAALKAVLDADPDLKEAYSRS